MRQMLPDGQESTNCASVFEQNRYVVLRSLLKEPMLTQFYRYARLKAQSGQMESGDNQVPGTPCSIAI